MIKYKSIYSAGDRYRKKRKNGMKYGKRVSGLAVAAVCLLAAPMQAMAGSPEFAYTAEKWASLRDDKLEYGEIADLIHEYNNTVIQNQIEYKDYKDKTQDDISQDYYDAADDVASSLNYPDSDDENYASGLSSYLNGKQQADTLRESGDNNVEDGEIKKLEYDQTEAELVKEAQGLMITYWNQVWNISNLEQTKEQAWKTYESAAAKQAAGTATSAQVLSAKEAVTSAEASILSAQSSLAKTKESLCLMLGWSYGAEAEICELPETDLEAIAAIDIESAVESGLEANYSLKIQSKKIANARSVSNKESLEEEYKSQKETAAASIKSAYRSLLLAKSDYDQAVQAYTLEQETLKTAERTLQAGTITRNEYAEQQSSCAKAEISVQTKLLALRNAQLEYESAAGGLASVS